MAYSPGIAKEISYGSQTLIRIFSNGTVERPSQSAFIPAIPNDPTSTLKFKSKDIIISLFPLIVARIYLPKPNHHHHKRDKFPILIYFHGGAFLYESAFSKVYDTYFRTFVPQANTIVVSVEYRLAPENPIPACYEDCWHVLHWVSSHSLSANYTGMRFPWLNNHGDFNRIFIGGDGAGANIAHNVSMRAGTEALPGGVKIVGAILSRPFFYSSYPIGSEPVIDPNHNIVYSVWNMVYPSAPGGIDNPVVNPVGPGAPSLATLGCSRIIVCVAANDQFRDRGVWYYEAVKKSGWKGKVELFEEKDEDHIYHILHPQSENAQKLIKRLVSFILNE
ncbi:hypothetical protein Lal_00011670 [Lupinus albus]|uniref:Putative carboxylesterase, 2-hydroxyisoflavanone dehydratase n=1 Tax=Lupinus albus TaxID=3870 RepID=A0A6A4QDH1_LUPAL|nr:putative carboxylesterase, 2-hydroxyisoflavanone dehydratase [Lupinus albus]KAF1880611.1 hypothetical protein Lal_00011670 [Lupinus albus]